MPRPVSLRRALLALVLALYAHDLWAHILNAREAARARPQARAAFGALPVGSRTAVLLPVHRRPAYLRRTLDALAACRGARDVVYIASHDGALGQGFDPSVADLLRAFRARVAPAPLLVLRHRKSLLARLVPMVAVGRNMEHLLDFALATGRRGEASRSGAEVAVVVEDDVVLARDALAFLRWALRAAERRWPKATLSASAYNHTGARPPPRGPGPGGEPRVAERLPRGSGGRAPAPGDRVTSAGSATSAASATSAGSPPHVPPPSPHDLALYGSSFSTWGWAVSARGYAAHLQGRWSRGSNWDLVFKGAQRRRGLVSVSPAVSRSEHVGARGVNFASPAASLREDPSWGAVETSDGRARFVRRGGGDARANFLGACSVRAAARGRAPDTCSGVEYVEPWWYALVPLVEPARSAAVAAAAERLAAAADALWAHALRAHALRADAEEPP
jgi:hypothetical protein